MNVIKDVEFAVTKGEAVSGSTSAAADVVRAAWSVAESWSETTVLSSVGHIDRGRGDRSYSSAVDRFEVLRLGDELRSQLLSMDDSDTEDFQEFKRRLGY